MKFLVLLALVAFIAAPLMACSGCNPGPTFSLRNPLLIDREAGSKAGPRLMQVPTYYAPQYVPTAPVSLPAGYTASPCP